MSNLPGQLNTIGKYLKNLEEKQLLEEGTVKE
jgi:hypothetical protein